MALIESWVKCELSRAVQVQYLQGNLFSADNQGNLVGVRVFENGEPASLSGSVSANVIRADGTTVPVAGTLTNGNECYVILPQAAYAVTGVVTIVIKITASSVVTTLAAIVSTVYASTTDAIVDPGTIIPSIETLIEAIEAAVATIPADYSSLWATIAPAYTSLTFPVSKGQYCTNNGHMYRAKQDIATSETFTSSHWEVCNVGVELFNQIGAGNQAISELKSALGIVFLPFTTNYYINTNKSVGSTVDYAGSDLHSTTGRNCAVYSCVEGEPFTIFGGGGNDSRLWAFIDSNSKLIIKSDANLTAPADGLVVYAPKNANKIIINTTQKAYKGITIERTVDLIDNVKDTVENSLIFNTVDFTPCVGAYSLVTKELYVNNNYRSILIKNYGIAAIKVSSISATNIPSVIFYSGIPASGTYLGYYETTKTELTDEIVYIPEGTEYIAVNTYVGSGGKAISLEIASNQRIVPGESYEYIVTTGGGYSASTKEWYSNANYKSVLLSCSEGDIFVITTVTAGTLHLALAYTGAPASGTFITDFNKNGDAGTWYEDTVIIAPKGCTKMAINGYSTYDMSIKKIAYSQIRYAEEESAETGFQAKVSSDVLTVKPNRAYNGKLITVVMKKRGGNNLFDFDSITASDSNGTDSIESNVTDWFMPFKVKAVNNADGDNTGSYYFTGGNHRSNNQSSGGVATATLDSLKFFADGVETSDFNGMCNEIRVEWQYKVTGFNTTKENGEGRLILQANHILTIRDGEFKVRTILTPLEDVKMLTYYGYGMHGTGDNCYARYLGSQTNRVATAINTQSSSGGRTTDSLSIEKGVYHMNCKLDKSLDMGRMNYLVSATSDSFTNSNKMYWYLVDTEMSMDEGDKYFIDAVYRFY